MTTVLSRYVNGCTVLVHLCECGSFGYRVYGPVEVTEDGPRQAVIDQDEGFRTALGPLEAGIVAAESYGLPDGAPAATLAPVRDELEPNLTIEDAYRHGRMIKP